MKDNKIGTLRFDDDFMLDAAEGKYNDGDYLGALTLLNKRESMHGPLADAYALAADVYEGMGLYSLAADSWFRFLDTCNEADFGEGYEGLAIDFMNMGNDLQSGYYYRRALYADGADGEEPEIEFEPEPPRPKLRLVHGLEGADSSEELSEGLTLLKMGALSEAREVFEGVPEDSSDHASAAGLAAMCTLMLGDEAGAQKACEELVARYPENVQVLTTYCAVLDARDDPKGAREVARRLSSLKAERTDDLYRISTALCETGLNEEAFQTLGILRGRVPYDENVLWFYAVAACKTGRYEDSIDALETLTTVFPRKAVAHYYLVQLRKMRDGGGKVVMNYYYRLPEAQYRKVASFLLRFNDPDDGKDFPEEEFAECFALAFDEMEGRDAKLQMLASKVAVKLHADALLRAVLLDAQGDDVVKLSILHDLVKRNAEDSFGTVICNIYKEFFTHEIELGRKKRDDFLEAFSDVYAKYVLIDEDNEGKICAAGEDIYRTLDEYGAWELFEDRAALAAAIYREARLKGGEHTLRDICKLFDADILTTERILDHMM